MILPKFDSSGSLIFGAVISLLLFVLNLVSIVIGRHDSFFPFQLTRLLGMAVGIALGIHCLDMKGYYAKRPRGQVQVNDHPHPRIQYGAGSDPLPFLPGKDRRRERKLEARPANAKDTVAGSPVSDTRQLT